MPNSGLCVECGASSSLIALTSSVSSGVRSVALPVSAAAAKVSELFSVVKIYGGFAVHVQCKGKDVRVHVPVSESSPAVDFTIPWSHPCPELMFAEVGSNAATLRLLLVSPSGAVGYYVNGAAKWVRHESLAAVQDVQLLPLPSALTAGFKGRGTKPSLASRLLDSATSFVTKVAPQHEDEIELSEQLIVALTSSGQVSPSFTRSSASPSHRHRAGLRHSQLHGICSLVPLSRILCASLSEFRRRLDSFICSNSCQETYRHPLHQ